MSRERRENGNRFYLAHTEYRHSTYLEAMSGSHRHSRALKFRFEAHESDPTANVPIELTSLKSDQQHNRREEINRTTDRAGQESWTAEPMSGAGRQNGVSQANHKTQ